MSSPVSSQISFRPAIPGDSSDLAILTDAASRRLVSFMWGHSASPGQSDFEVGRQSIRSNEDDLSHYSNWQVAQRDDTMVGAVCSFCLWPQNIEAGTDQKSRVLKPMNELKLLARGTWYISVASVFAENRGRGIGKVLLVQAASMARKNDYKRLTLLVGSFNENARQFYLRSGFKEWQRRPFTPFAGSDVSGEWILMFKDLD